MNLFLDINTGELRRTLSGPVLPILHFHQNDVLSLDITLTDGGAAVTTTELGSDKTLVVSLRAIPFTLTTLVSGGTPTIAIQVASVPFDLRSQEVADYLADYVAAAQRSSQVFFEIDIAKPNGSYRQTLHQSRVLLFRDLNAQATAVIPDDAILHDEEGNVIVDEEGNQINANNT